MIFSLLMIVTVKRAIRSTDHVTSAGYIHTFYLSSFHSVLSPWNMSYGSGLTGPPFPYIQQKKTRLRRKANTTVAKCPLFYFLGSQRHQAWTVICPLSLWRHDMITYWLVWPARLDGTLIEDTPLDDYSLSFLLWILSVIVFMLYGYEISNHVCIFLGHSSITVI